MDFKGAGISLMSNWYRRNGCVSPLKIALTDKITGEFNKNNLFNIKRDSLGRILEYNRLYNGKKVLCTRNSYDIYGRHRYYKQESLGDMELYYEQYIIYLDNNYDIFGRRKVYQKTVSICKTTYHVKRYEAGQIDDKPESKFSMTEAEYNDRIKEITDGWEVERALAMSGNAYESFTIGEDVLPACYYNEYEVLPTNEVLAINRKNIKLIKRLLDNEYSFMKEYVNMYERTNQIIMSESLKYIIYQTYLKEKKQKKEQQRKSPRYIPDEELTPEQLDKRVLRRILRENPITNARYKELQKTNKQEAQLIKDKILYVYHEFSYLTACQVDYFNLDDVHM